MLKAKDVAKWFIFHNPKLASGYIDENTKINKLLYFSNLMYYCVNDENLIEDSFVAFPNGPVVYSIYRDYRYNGLNAYPQSVISPDRKQGKILDIINFVYAESPVSELIEESHSHSLWKDVSHHIPNNPTINFENTDAEIKEYYKNLYEAYYHIDFAKIAKEKINGNIYYYNRDAFNMTEEIVSELSSLERFDEPKFIEMVEDEWVLS